MSHDTQHTRRKLPKWIPQVSKPWNPAYKEVWEAMTPNEKRWSFLVDVIVVAVVLICIGIFK